MISLGTLGERFQSTIISETGLPFMGTFQPIEDSKIYPDDFFEVRQILRVHAMVPITAGDTIMFANGRRFLLGTLENALSADVCIYVSFQLYPCNKKVLWKRETTQVDALTRLEKATGLETLGDPWVLIETLVREAHSANINTMEETKRVITGAPVELGDVIDGMKVRKVNIAHGVRILEVM